MSLLISLALAACVGAVEVEIPAPAALPAALPVSAAAVPQASAALPAPIAVPLAVEGVARSGAVAPAATSLLTAAPPAQASKPAAAQRFAAVFDGAGTLSKLERAYVAPPANRSGVVNLSRLDPSDTGGLSKKAALKRLANDQVKLDALQQVLYADSKRRVLIVLQAMDTGGKDGTVRHVMRSLNPQGVQVASFKKPTPEEAAEGKAAPDGFLARVRRALVKPGMIGIFNRSHYEDILAPTVYGTFPPEEIEKRYDIINSFEKELTDQGWVVLKFFLHISKDEQKRRLQARLDDPDKNWKFSPEDLKSRHLWPQFMNAYQKVLARTNTSYAPWFVIPANNKWYRDYLIGRIIKKAMKRMDLRYPPPPPGLKGLKIPD